jgi:hypothetical protein
MTMSTSSNDNHRSDNYLYDELKDRMQKDPELFEWIQQAALDGLWYVYILFACILL